MLSCSQVRCLLRTYFTILSVWSRRRLRCAVSCFFICGAAHPERWASRTEPIKLFVRDKHHTSTMYMLMSTGARHRQRMAALTQLLGSEEHTSELQSQSNLVCRLLLEKKYI